MTKEQKAKVYDLIEEHHHTLAYEMEKGHVISGCTLKALMKGLLCLPICNKGGANRVRAKEMNNIGKTRKN